MKPHPIDLNRRHCYDARWRRADKSVVYVADKQAEGLGCACELVLHAGKTDGIVGQIERFSERPLHLAGGHCLLGNVDIEMLAGAACLVERDLLDDEGVRRGPQLPADARQLLRSVRQCQIEFHESPGGLLTKAAAKFRHRHLAEL